MWDGKVTQADDFYVTKAISWCLEFAQCKLFATEVWVQMDAVEMRPLPFHAREESVYATVIQERFFLYLFF